ncbi:MAG: S8 family serine peptidase [Sulfuricaulis sp.]|nr:S8 family serine peptidase [Sulfuricaulis sp.]
MPGNAQEEAASSYIFVFRSDFPADRVPEEANRLATEHGGAVRHTFKVALKGFSATLSAQAAARLAEQNPHIAYYERNGVVSAIEQVDETAVAARGGAGKPGSSEPPQVVPYGILRVGGPIGGSGRHAWVIDTGIDLNHPDLAVGGGANFVLRGKNSPDDGNGHGTHVSGTIAALDNAIDVVGVAASATVHPVRVLDNSGSGTIDGVVASVDYVAANADPARGDAVNMSLGATGHFQSLHDAIINTANLGIRFAVAAGNDASNAGGFEPAHIDHPNVYTVSAIDNADVFANFSNYGNPPIDFAAPGVSIVSTAKGGGVTTMSGTSMATPHVCGLLLLGVPQTNGNALQDPDGTADPIVHY